MASVAYNFIKIRRYYIVGMAVATVVDNLPRTVLINQIKDIIQKYDSKFVAVPLSPEIKEMYNEVLDDLHTSDSVRQSLNPIMTYGVEPNYYGLIGPNLKCLICIPQSFDFKQPYDVPTSPISWKSGLNLENVDGKDCRDAFVLSKKAQKYSLARIICEAESKLNYAYSIIPAFTVGQSFIMFHQCVTKFQKFLQRSKWHRRGIFSMVGVSSLLLYLIARDFCNLAIEKEADHKVSLLGQEYVEGGVECIDKNLWRNRITRYALPEWLKWKITKEGEITQYLRLKHTSLIDRKKELEELSNSS